MMINFAIMAHLIVFLPIKWLWRPSWLMIFVQWDVLDHCEKPMVPRNWFSPCSQLLCKCLTRVFPPKWPLVRNFRVSPGWWAATGAGQWHRGRLGLTVGHCATNTSNNLWRGGRGVLTVIKAGLPQPSSSAAWTAQCDTALTIMENIWKLTDKNISSARRKIFAGSVQIDIVHQWPVTKHIAGNLARPL